MSTEKQHWRKALYTIRQYTSPRAGDLERELAGMRSDYLQLELRASALLSERDRVREDLNKAQQHIESVRAELDTSIKRHERLAGEQQQRLDARQQKLDQAQRRVQVLETALAAAPSRQENIAGSKVKALESKLDEQRRGYEADLHALRETLARVQREQRELSARGGGSRAAGSVPNAEPLPAEAMPLPRGGGRRLPGGLPSGAGGHRWRGNWAMLAAGFPLLLGALAGATTFWDEGKITRERLHLMTPLAASGNAERAETDAGEPGLGDTADGAQQVASLQKVKRDRPRAIRRKPIVHGHWGPALFMQDKQATRKTRGVAFDPLVEQQQRDLLDMGFDLGQARADGLKGSRTEQALDEFKALYLPETGVQAAPSSDQLAVIIGNYAALARSDEQKFNVDRGVLAAIRLSSVRTGVDFSYLMELAAAESNFNPASKAAGTSARGLYQFTRETWLHTVKKHGDNYGLGIYTAQIEYYVDRAGRRRPMVRDTDVLEHILELRHNPRVSAMMAAESVNDNLNRLMFSFDREPGRTELYLTHFLGVDGAISFLKLRDNNPDKMAGDVFPGAAQSNRSIFHSQPCRPRTVNEVYEIFDSKFNTSRYEDFNPG